jgi:hypothetical protein
MVVSPCAVVEPVRKALVIWASVTLALSAVPQQDESYDYAEPVKQFCLAISKSLKTVRGILVVCNYMGGDSRGYYTQNWYSEFMNLHGFAFLGSKGDPSHAVSYQAFLRAVKQFSIDSHHPELVNAPSATTGFSAGGGFASTLLTRDPDRASATRCAGSKCWRCPYWTPPCACVIPPTAMCARARSS